LRDAVVSGGDAAELLLSLYFTGSKARLRGMQLR